MCGCPCHFSEKLRKGLLRDPPQLPGLNSPWSLCLQTCGDPARWLSCTSVVGGAELARVAPDPADSDTKMECHHSPLDFVRQHKWNL
ncbi:Hypothetical predicted protein, partial [Lynx pardinus]